MNFSFLHLKKKIENLINNTHKRAFNTEKPVPQSCCSSDAYSQEGPRGRGWMLRFYTLSCWMGWQGCTSFHPASSSPVPLTGVLKGLLVHHPGVPQVTRGPSFSKHWHYPVPGQTWREMDWVLVCRFIFVFSYLFWGLNPEPLHWPVSLAHFFFPLF